MKKLILILFYFIFLVNFSFSQNEPIKSLLEETNKIELDILGLTEFAKDKIKDKETIAKFFYYWVSTNIEYDHKSLEDKKNGIISREEFGKRQETFQVYKNRKAVCAGYARLFKLFMDSVDIECNIVKGHIRDERNHYIELKSDHNFSHAWNAIKLNNKWKLVDSTWGTSNDKSQSEFYFDIKPEHSIITHYPENSEWQLLKEPLSLEQFNNSKFIKPFWFFVGFSDIPKLMSDKDFYYFVFTNNPNTEWSPFLLHSFDNINFKHIRELTSIKQDGKTYYKFKKLAIAEKTFFKVNLSHLKDNRMTTYEDIINFKIQ